MNTLHFHRESFHELLAAAISPDATQRDIDALGMWLRDYGTAYWNGEYYDASDAGDPTGSRRVYPVYEEDEFGDPVVTGYRID